MPGEPLHLRDRADLLERVEELIEQMAPRDIEPVRRNAAGRAAIPHGEGFVQDPRDARGKARARMIALQESTTSQQMPETGLMKRVRELAIGRPAVARQAPGEVGPEHRRSLREEPRLGQIR
jgi:hypothetical protein